MPQESLPEQVGNSLRDLAAGAIEDGIRGSFRDLSNPAEAIRAGGSGGAAQKAQVAFGRAACRRWARGQGPQGALADAINAPLCQPYLEDIGEWPGSGSYAPPFSGGQCSINYRVFARRVRTDGADLSTCIDDGVIEITPAGGLPGPIGGIVFSSTNTGPPSFIPVDEAALIFGGGQQSPLGGRFSGCSQPFFTITSVVPVGGAPDVCGDPKDGYDPAPKLPDDGYDGTEPWGPGLPDIRIDFNPDGSINIDLPDVDTDGPRTVPDRTNPDNYPGPITELPEPPPPGDQGDAGGAGTTGDGGEEEGEAPPGQVLVGVLIEVLSGPPDKQGFIDPDVWKWPCWVYMGGDAGLDQDLAGQYLRSPQFVHAETENATRYRVVANIGYNLRVTPYYREVEE